jgi:hypothetical protein
MAATPEDEIQHTLARLQDERERATKLFPDSIEILADVDERIAKVMVFRLCNHQWRHSRNIGGKTCVHCGYIWDC